MLRFAAICLIAAVAAKEVVISLTDNPLAAAAAAEDVIRMQTSAGQAFECRTRLPVQLTPLHEVLAQLVLSDGECVVSDLNPAFNYWQYKLCVNRTVSQVRLEDGGEPRRVASEILLGRFSSSRRGDDQEEEQWYEGGDANRTARVRFVCLAAAQSPTTSSSVFTILTAVESQPLRYELSVGVRGAQCGHSSSTNQGHQQLDNLPCLQRQFSLEAGFNTSANQTLREHATFRLCPGKAVSEIDAGGDAVREIGQFVRREEVVVVGGRAVEVYEGTAACEGANKYTVRVVYSCNRQSVIPVLLHAQRVDCGLVLFVRLHHVCDAESDEVDCSLVGG